MKVLAKPWTMNVGNDPSTTAWTFVSNCRSPPIPCSLSPGVKSDALLFGTIRLTLSWRRVSIVSHLCELVLRRFSLSSSIPRTDAIAALCCSSLFSSFASPLSSYWHLVFSGSNRLESSMRYETGGMPALLQTISLQLHRILLQLFRILLRR